MELYDFCLELQNELNGRKGFVNNQVDIAKCRALIARILECLPDFVQSAERVISNRANILNNADIVAQNVLREAEDRAVLMVSESEIIRRAEDKGNDIIEEAYRKCDKLVIVTKEHLDELLKDTETFLKQALHTVTTNRFDLKNLIVNAGNKSK